MTQAGVSSAVTWYFVQAMIPEIVTASRYPVQEAFSRAAERLPQFQSAAHGDGTCLPVLESA
jgi:hypothetical protein